MNEIKSILNILNEIESQISSISKKETEICFRGYCNFEWQNVPSIFRDGRLEKELHSIIEYERNFPNDSQKAIDILTQLQHYGCPTRMLDVTTNCFVALFFACGGLEKVVNPKTIEETKHKDGLIQIFSVPKDDVKSINSETVVLLSNISRIKTDTTFGQLLWQCQKDQNGVWYQDEELVQQNVEDVNKVFLVKSALNNPRVRAQFGEFFLFGGVGGIEGYEYAHKTIIEQTSIWKKRIDIPKKYLLQKISIPSSEKDKLLQVLERYFGISFATLCPEKADIIKTIMN